MMQVAFLTFDSDDKELIQVLSDVSEINVAHLNAGMYVLVLKP